VRLVGKGDVDGVAFDYAVAGGWSLADDGADGGDGAGDRFRVERGGARWGLSSEWGSFRG